jgi:predicted Zn finger-like uncharacterized protein
MQFSCDNCHAKYQIADEKASGRTLKMTCRHCSHVIFIRGGEGARTSGPAEASATPERASVAGSAPERLSSLPEGTVENVPSMLLELKSLDTGWHVAINDVPLGPFPVEEIARKISVGAVTASSLCWREGLEEWKKLGEIPELTKLLETSVEASPLAAARASVPPRPLSMPPAEAEHGDARAARPATPLAEPMAAAPEKARERLGAGRFTMAIAFGVLCGVAGYLAGQRDVASTDESPTAPIVREEPKPALAEATEPAVEPEPLDEAPSEPEAPSHEAAKPLSAKPRASTVSSAPVGVAEAPVAPPPAKPAERPLTAEEKRLLERYAGGSGAPATSPISTSTGAHAGSTTTSTPTAPAPSSGLDSAAVTQVVNQNMAALKQCHERATRGMSMVSAMRINVSVTVGASGVVTRALAVGDSPPGLNVCIEAAVKRWHFPAGGEARFPVVFPAS